MNDEAEDSYHTILEIDGDNIEARVQLAKMCEEYGQMDQAMVYVNEVILLGRQQKHHKKGGRPIKKLLSSLENMVEKQKTTSARLTPEGSGPGFETMLEPKRKAIKGRRRAIQRIAEKTDEERAREAQLKQDHMRLMYINLQELRPRMRDGDEEATAEWMDAASELIQDFRSVRVFYPWDRMRQFFGYSNEARRKTFMPKYRQAMAEMADLTKRIEETEEQLPEHVKRSEEVPTNYRDIAFDTWLDIFLEYALALAKQDEADEAYGILKAAADCNVFYHSKEFTFRIHVAGITCALALNDPEALSNETRWFVTKHSYANDSYRLFAALHLVLDNPDSLYTTGPTQKYFLRSIKAIDAAVAESDPKYHQYIRNTEEYLPALDPDETPRLNVVLLTLYGHMLLTNDSEYEALNYFYRAYALDPGNPMILLSIGVAYIQYGIKRLAPNRHYLIAQGLSFIHKYKDIRLEHSTVQIKQEALYNTGRAYHMLGLTDLAAHFYKQLLDLSDAAQERKKDNATTDHAFIREDFTHEAAFALQVIYGFSGNMGAAMEVTERWLVV